MTSNGFLEELETVPGESVLEGAVGEAVRGIYIGEMGQDCLLHRQLRKNSVTSMPKARFGRRPDLIEICIQY